MNIPTVSDARQVIVDVPVSHNVYVDLWRNMLNKDLRCFGFHNQSGVRNVVTEKISNINITTL